MKYHGIQVKETHFKSSLDIF